MTHADAPRGDVGITDMGWYEFLRDAPEIDEVNFWRPKDQRRFRAVPHGSPFGDAEVRRS